MTVFNRRNAAVGWLAWVFRKRLLRHVARDAMPALDAKSKRPNKSALALAIAGMLESRRLAQAESDQETVARSESRRRWPGVFSSRCSRSRLPPRRWATLAFTTKARSRAPRSSRRPLTVTTKPTGWRAPGVAVTVGGFAGSGARVLLRADGARRRNDDRRDARPLPPFGLSRACQAA